MEGFHLRNKPGQKQREAVSAYASGSRKKPAFRVGCDAVAIIHGTLDQTSKRRASLLIYDFSFFSYRSARIKEATISFQFLGKDGDSAGAPAVQKVAPFASHTMMQTTQNETLKVSGQGGISGGAVVTLNTSGTVEKSVEKTTTHSAEITGVNPADDWGNRFRADWYLRENASQKTGIVRQLRICILLTRDADSEFSCIPIISVTPNLAAKMPSLFSPGPHDDPIIFDPEYLPFNALGENIQIDQWNLAAVPLEKVWDCTFHSTFAEAVKDSRTSAPLKESSGQS